MSPSESLIVALGTGLTVDFYRVFSEEERMKKLQKKLRKARKKIDRLANFYRIISGLVYFKELHFWGRFVLYVS